MATWKELVDTSSTQTLAGKTLTAAALGSSTATTHAAGTSDTTVATTAFATAAGAAGDTSLSDSKIWIGNGSDVKAEYILSGDVTMSDEGVVAIKDDKVGSAELVDACTAVTSFTAPLIEGSTSVQTPLIEFTDGDNAIVITDTGLCEFPVATTHTGGVQTATIDFTDGDLAMTIADGGAVTTSGALTVTGDLTVNGTTTTVNTATLEVEDHVVLLATNASPTPDTGTASGIQVETSATEAHMPEITWTKDIGASNDGTYDGSGAIDGLTGWKVSNHQATNQADFAIQVCDYKSDTGAPASSKNSAGRGAMLLNTYDQKVYVRTA